MKSDIYDVVGSIPTVDYDYRDRLEVLGDRDFPYGYSTFDSGSFTVDDWNNFIKN